VPRPNQVLRGLEEGGTSAQQQQAGDWFGPLPTMNAASADGADEEDEANTSTDVASTHTR
jgi:hypothetical protein